MICLGIVVPCFNEQEVLPETTSRLKDLLARLVAAGMINEASRVYYIDDGSRDRTWAIIEDIAATDPRFCGIKLSRNCGHQNALIAGLLTARGDVLISIDADLQDDLGAITEMLRAHGEGADIVYGVRDDRRADTRFKRLSAELYYRLLAAMGVQIVFNHADYRLLSRRAIQALASFREVNLFLRGIIPQLGFRTATVTYRRGERFAGESKYPLRKMVALALQGVTSFTAAPLRFITGLGLTVCAGSFALALWAVLTRLLSDAALPGWASTVVPMYFLGGVQLLSLGVIGEYLSKIYLEVKARPRFFVDRLVGDGVPHVASPINGDAAHESLGSQRPDPRQAGSIEALHPRSAGDVETRGAC